MPKKASSGPHLSPQQVAERMGVTEATVRRWLRNKQMAGHKIGPKVWRVSVTALPKVAR